ncbi:MAG: UDP-3-O-acyl-N-acetylglucosamine deacetylase [Pseudomonadota bacterium]
MQFAHDAQRTLKTDIGCTGIGLHSGSKVSLKIRPADINTGIRFLRTDVADGTGLIVAQWDKVTDTRLCTLLSNDHGVTIGTVEHILSALRGCEIDNALVEVDGPEVPIMDGSAEPFVFLIDCAGTVSQAASRQAIRVLRPVEVKDGDKSARLTPAGISSFSFMIDFPSPAISRQEGSIQLINGAYRHDVARARTFGFAKEAERLRASGLARGASLENAIVLRDDRVLNAGGLRFSDEFVRHKLLDAVGDLYLAGAPILGHYHGHKAGHKMNNDLLRALLTDDSAWCYDTVGEPEAAIA